VSETSFDPSPLLCSKPFQELLALEQEVSPFEVFGIEASELVHSRILGRLLASDGPLGFGTALMPRLATAMRMAGSRSCLDVSWIVSLSAAHFKVQLEYPCRVQETGEGDLGRMDLLLEDERQKLAIVIENKVWAGEQDRQIERYQTWLVKERKGWQALVIFLTPNGVDPTQWKKDDSGVSSCACLSWRDIFRALEGLDTRDASGVIRAFRQNIRRHIMGESQEKKLVRQIMSNPDLAAVVSTIIKHMPKIDSIREELERGVHEITGKEIHTLLYPSKRGDVREIKIYLKPWEDAGAPICFNFYDGDFPALRTMLLNEDWSTFAPIAKKLAALENSAIHKECPIRSDWTPWRLVMADDDNTDDAWKRTIIADRSYSPESAKALLEIFRERYLKLKPTMDQFLSDPERFGGTRVPTQL